MHRVGGLTAIAGKAKAKARARATAKARAKAKAKATANAGILRCAQNDKRSLRMTSDSKYE